jgi:hypothetical protein
MADFFTRFPAQRPVEVRIASRETCPICDAQESTYLFAKAQRRLLRCASCNLLGVERGREKLGVPGSKTGITKEGNLQNGASGEIAPPTNESFQRAFSAARASLLRDPEVPIRVGWIGPRNDRFTDAAGELGVAVSQIEAYWPEWRDPDWELSELRAPNSARSPRVFDVCVLATPLERWSDPRSILRTVHLMLDIDGIVMVACENLMPARPRYSDWEFNRETRYLYNLETATALLFRAGYGRIKAVNPPSKSSRRMASTDASVLIASKRYAEDPATHRNKLSIVMPVFNEKATFSQIFELVCTKEVADLEKEIIVVESNSTDGSREDVLSIGGREGVKIILEDRPRGKGHAVRNGLAQATGDFVIIQDADLEYDIEDYDILLDPLTRYLASFVLGTRHGRDGGGLKMRHFEDQKATGWIMNVGHLFFTQLFNVVYGQHLADPFTMFKVFRRDCIDGLTFESNRFDFDWEIMAKLVRRGYIPIEIPINYTSRSFSAGKKVSFFRDPLTWMWACFKYRFVKV